MIDTARRPYVDSDWAEPSMSQFASRADYEAAVILKANADLALKANRVACITSACKGRSENCPTKEACLLPENAVQARALRFFDRLARFLGWSK